MSSYSDWVEMYDDDDEVEECEHGIPFDEECEECEEDH